MASLARQSLHAQATEAATEAAARRVSRASPRRRRPLLGKEGAVIGTSGSLPPALVVVLGAIPGAWIRYTLVRLGSTRLSQRHWATWGVNMVACCLMGLLVGLQPRWDRTTRDTLVLALAIGFLGSLSTYSTLMAELVSLWQGQGKRHAVRLATASLLGGLLACFLGLQLARAQR